MTDGSVQESINSCCSYGLITLTASAREETRKVGSIARAGGLEEQGRKACALTSPAVCRGPREEKPAENETKAVGKRAVFPIKS